MIQVLSWKSTETLLNVKLFLKGKPRTKHDLELSATGDNFKKGARIYPGQQNVLSVIKVKYYYLCEAQG